MPIPKGNVLKKWCASAEPAAANHLMGVKTAEKKMTSSDAADKADIQQQLNHFKQEKAAATAQAPLQKRIATVEDQKARKRRISMKTESCESQQGSKAKGNQK